MSAFEDDRSALSGLHFAQDAMKQHEKRTLRLAEAMLRRCDAVLELHVQAPPWEDYPQVSRSCAECTEDWPCPTVRAITGEEN